MRILVVDDSPTIRKVVGAILSRHGFDSVGVSDGQSALDALNEGERFDLVLLDFVMPRMNGYQFCRAARSQERFKTLPVILMSAKSDKIREQFVQQTGAIDAITKPFDAEALVAVIENGLRRVGDGTARTEVVSFDDGEPMSIRSPSVPDESVRVARAAVEFGAKLAKSLAPTLARLPAGAIGDEAQIATSLANRLTPDLLRDIGMQLRDLDFGERGQVVLSGDVAALPIGAILQMLQVERQTGVLDVVRGADKRTSGSPLLGGSSDDKSARAPQGSEVTITWRNGLVDLVQSRGAGDEFRLGRFFVEEGLVTPEEIDTLLKKSDPPGSGAGPKSSRRILGEVLLEAGRVNEDQLRAALVRQASELIYEVLRWQRGRYEFRQRAPSPLAVRARLSLPVASVVMEGFRRVDEWRLVEASLGSFDAVLVRDPMAIAALGDGRIARSERNVLDAIDGERTVREVIHASHMSSFDGCRILSQLLEARLVRRRATE